MLEFIILGQIPGTGVFLSFNEVALTAITFSLAGFLAIKMIKHHRETATEEKQVNIKQQTI